MAVQLFRTSNEILLLQSFIKIRFRFENTHSVWHFHQSPRSIGHYNKTKQKIVCRMTSSNKNGVCMSDETSNQKYNHFYFECSHGRSFDFMGFWIFSWFLLKSVDAKEKSKLNANRNSLSSNEPRAPKKRSGERQIGSVASPWNYATKYTHTCPHVKMQTNMQIGNSIASSLVSFCSLDLDGIKKSRTRMSRPYSLHICVTRKWNVRR